MSLCCLGRFSLVFVIFTSLSLFAENGWIPEELEGSIKKYAAQTRCLEEKFETSVPVEASSEYPHLSGISSLIDYVNNRIESCAKERFQKFVKSEKSSKEVLDNDFGGCFFSYNLYPVLVRSNLISIYGSEFQARDCPHGWTNHEGKNFWRSGDKIIELEIRDLFTKGRDWQNFLLHYCKDYFVQHGTGYYGMEDCYIPELTNEDLETFVLTERGLVIVFRSYVVGGWADGPYMLAIPYAMLKNFINPNGPIKEILTS